jgi:predicted small secreted protein
MKRFLSTVLLIAPLVAFGIAGCKKAHDAGNDSMSVGGSKIEASASGTGSGASAEPRK